MKLQSGDRAYAMTLPPPICVKNETSPSKKFSVAFLPMSAGEGFEDMLAPIGRRGCWGRTASATMTSA